MEHWLDQGIVLKAMPHGEGGAIVFLLTEKHGRHAGYVHGISARGKRALLELGTNVEVEWRARTNDNLGTFKLEQIAGLPHRILEDSLRLGALMSASSLCDQALPEREGHPGLYFGLQALIQTLGGDVWAAAYIMWEIALLKELGFGLELTKCAGGGDPQTLAYVSPKSGRAVSYAAGEPYKDKLLELPAFLKPNGGPADHDAIRTGLKMTGHFLEHWVFNHHSRGVPEARLRFEALYAKTIAGLNELDKQVDHTERVQG